MPSGREIVKYNVPTKRLMLKTYRNSTVSMLEIIDISENINEVNSITWQQVHASQEI
jgi:hypothetical protein